MAEIIGRRLQILIKETGKQQQEIADELGIKVPTFNGYIGNKREPSFEKLVQFAKYFNVTVDYLTGCSDQRNPYLMHLPPDLNSFVRDPENAVYISLAREIKEKTHGKGSERKSV